MKLSSGLFMISILVFFVWSLAHAERYVVVNGQRLSIPEIHSLEQLHCAPVPNGRYWINLQSGFWGFEGNPQPQGYVSDNCRNPQRRPSLAERGMLFSPHDWVR